MGRRGATARIRVSSVHMPRRSKVSPAGSSRSARPAEKDDIVQLKVWSLGISPMIWRRLLVPSSCTLEELHGIIQVTMGWEGIHL